MKPIDLSQFDGMTPGPLAWQKFGNEYCLTGQYGHRPIILSCTPKGQLKLLDKENCLLVPFAPDHPDAIALASVPALVAELKAAREALAPLLRLYAGQFTNTGEYYPQLFDAVRALLPETKSNQ